MVLTGQRPKREQVFHHPVRAAPSSPQSQEKKLIFPMHVHLGTPCDLMLQVTVWPFGGQSPRLLCALMELFAVPELVFPKGERLAIPHLLEHRLVLARSAPIQTLKFHRKEFWTDSHCFYFPIFFIVNSFCSWEYFLHSKSIQNSFTRKTRWSKVDA